MLRVLDMYWLTFYIAVFYGIVMLILTLISQLLQRGVYDIKIFENKIDIYCKSVYRIRNIFDSVFSMLISIFFLYKYFFYNSDWRNIVFSLLGFSSFNSTTRNFFKNKGMFFNTPFRQIDITDVGYLVNDELLVYDSEKDRVELAIKKIKPSYGIYYSISISNYYNSIELIKPIPNDELNEFIEKLQEFFSNNGIQTVIKKIE